MEFINNINTVNVHTQHLIEKLTDHFYGTQLTAGMGDKFKVQEALAHLINKASVTVPAFTQPNRSVWTAQAVDIHAQQTSSVESSPSSSPIMFEDTPSSPLSNITEECGSDDYQFGSDSFEPTILCPQDLPSEMRANGDFLANLESELFFANPAFGLMNFLPMTPPPSVFRSLSRNTSKENCPLVQLIPAEPQPVQHHIVAPVAVKPEQPVAAVPPPPTKPNEMAKFSSDGVVDFKHVIYNLLVDNYNNPAEHTFVQPISMEVVPGVVKQGFKFNERENPDKRLPELYAQHIRKADLKQENQGSVFIQDLYKFYLRACVELLSKYFVKYDKYTFLFDDTVMFIAGGSLEDAEKRISKMGTIQRRQKKHQSDDYTAIKKQVNGRGKRANGGEGQQASKKRRS